MALGMWMRRRPRPRSWVTTFQRAAGRDAFTLMQSKGLQPTRRTKLLDQPGIPVGLR
jgi:hypothetical protein